MTLYRTTPARLALTLLLWMLLVALFCAILTLWFLPETAGPSIPRRTRPSTLYLRSTKPGIRRLKY